MAVAPEPLEARTLFSTYYVSTAPAASDSNPGTSDAAPFATLQRAANAVAAGDTVVVRAGTYSSGFVMGWDSNPSGTAAAPIRFLADPGAVITGRNARTADGIDLEPGTNYVEIHGFTVNNASGTITRAGIRVVGSDHVTVDGNTADACGTWGIFTGFANDLVIDGNVTSHAKTQHGIYVSNSGDRPVVRDNTSFGNHAAGIHMNGDASQGGDGIISGALVEGNVIYDNGAGGGSGINADGVQDSRFQNNLIYDEHASGISLFRQDGGGASTGNVVANNTILIASDGRWALNVQNASTGNTVLNNVLYDANPSHGAVDISADSLPGFTSDYNGVTNRFTTTGGDSVMSLASWRTQTGQDAHSFVVTDPAQVFVDPANNDYHLKSGSPAVDAGTASLAGQAAPTTDLDGHPRPSGPADDVGAYELQVAPAPTLLSAAPNGGGAQRSMVTKLTLTFDRPVTLSAADVTLTRRGGGAVGLALTKTSADGTVWDVTFTPGIDIGADGSLVDGIYDLSVPIAGATESFHRVYGDTDGDGDVDALDLLQFRNTLNKHPTDPGYLWYLDYDGNGIVDATDLFQVRSRLPVTFKGY